MPTDGRLLARIAHEMRAGWERGQVLLVEGYLAAFPALLIDEQGTLDLIVLEWRIRRLRCRRSRSELDLRAEYRQRFPQLADQLQREFEFYDLLEEVNALRIRRRAARRRGDGKQSSQ